MRKSFQDSIGQVMLPTYFPGSQHFGIFFFALPVFILSLPSKVGPKIWTDPIYTGLIQPTCSENVVLLKIMIITIFLCENSASFGKFSRLEAAKLSQQSLLWAMKAMDVEGSHQGVQSHIIYIYIYIYVCVYIYVYIYICIYIYMYIYIYILYVYLCIYL
jgi:hypothetical protein